MPVVCAGGGNTAMVNAWILSPIIKVAGVGLLVAVACQLLSKAGRDEQSMLVTLAGIVVVLLLLIQQIADLFELICTVFGFDRGKALCSVHDRAVCAVSPAVVQTGMGTVSPSVRIGRPTGRRPVAAAGVLSDMTTLLDDALPADTRRILLRSLGLHFCHRAVCRHLPGQRRNSAGGMGRNGGTAGNTGAGSAAGACGRGHGGRAAERRVKQMKKI